MQGTSENDGAKTQKGVDDISREDLIKLVMKYKENQTGAFIDSRSIIRVLRRHGPPLNESHHTHVTHDETIFKPIDRHNPSPHVTVN